MRVSTIFEKVVDRFGDFDLPVKSKGLTFSSLIVLKLNANELAGLDSFFSGWTAGFFKGFDGGGGKPANFGAVCVSKRFGFCVVVSGFDKPPNKEGPLLNGSQGKTEMDKQCFFFNGELTGENPIPR